MEQVTQIPTVGIDKQTIATLEDLLEKANTGELKSLMFIEKYKDGTCEHGWAGRPDKEMLGQVEVLKFDMLSRMFFPVEPE